MSLQNKSKQKTNKKTRASSSVACVSRGGSRQAWAPELRLRVPGPFRLTFANTVLETRTRRPATRSEAPSASCHLVQATSHAHTRSGEGVAANGATLFRTQTYTHEFKPHRTLSKLSVTHTPHTPHTNTHAVIYRRPPVRLSKTEGNLT